MARSKKTKKPVKKKGNRIAVLRGCLTVLAELCGIAGFLLAVNIFLKGG
jgi:hypothetical protein